MSTQVGAEFIPVHQAADWSDVLGECEQWDVYHLPEYHRLSEAHGEGEATLFVYREGAAMAAWPLLIRPIAMVEGLQEAGNGYSDATSVYGYPGPVWNPAARTVPEFFLRFRQAIEAALRERDVVCMFSRMHPIIGVAPWQGTDAPLEYKGQTISIDLSVELNEQASHYRMNHRAGIHRAHELGYSAHLDERGEHFEEFICLYHRTMERAKASPQYFFGREYFRMLIDVLGAKVHLFVAGKGTEVASAALFLCNGGVIHYHLGGSTEEGLHHSLSKMVIDEARKWGTGIGAHWLHLGGGRGVQKDSLFHFKAGFSHVRHDFFIWKSILLPEVYDRLTASHAAYLAGHGQHAGDASFFPLYRSEALDGQVAGHCDGDGAPGR